MTRIEQGRENIRLELAGAPMQGLPVAGYRSQTNKALDRVNENKRMEEALLRRLDWLPNDLEVDPRWLAIARTNLEQGFMALNRAIFKPERVKL